MMKVSDIKFDLKDVGYIVGATALFVTMQVKVSSLESEVAEIRAESKKHNSELIEYKVNEIYKQVGEIRTIVNGL